MIKKVKVGQVQVKKDKSGNTVQLGNNSKNPKYATTVELRVRDGEGNVLMQGPAQFLQMVDPRKNPRLDKEGNAYKTPDYILEELFITFDDGQQ